MHVYMYVCICVYVCVLCALCEGVITDNQLLRTGGLVAPALAVFDNPLLDGMTHTQSTEHR
jgi:hypothetical protein